MSLQQLFLGNHVLSRAIRFGGIGVLSSAVYALVTAALVSLLGVPPVTASLLGYGAALPVSFAGHRQVSFRSRGRPAGEALRFLVLQMVNIAVTVGAMHSATGWLGISYGWGIFAAVVLVPLASFIFMNLWVFRDQDGRAGVRRESTPVTAATTKPEQFKP